MAVLTDFLSLQCHENIAHTLTHTHTRTHTHTHTHTPRHRVTQGCAAGLVWACRLMHTLLHFLSSGCRHSAEKAVCKCCEPSLLQCVYGVCVRECVCVCVCVCVCMCVWERESICDLFLVTKWVLMPDLWGDCGHSIVEQWASLPWLLVAAHSLGNPIN